ncbi:unnamed protein product [Paramecium sonneborni]|uniref:G domain-containing protein n=1 Tax=Paramecium sonneborni TaxID=65129 RepID=A0A8S1RHV3_9CILI|nr:unnamed protein product [Paramecium sonneborni]
MKRAEIKNQKLAQKFNINLSKKELENNDDEQNNNQNNEEKQILYLPLILQQEKNKIINKLQIGTQQEFLNNLQMQSALIQQQQNYIIDQKQGQNQNKLPLESNPKYYEEQALRQLEKKKFKCDSSQIAKIDNKYQLILDCQRANNIQSQTYNNQLLIQNQYEQIKKEDQIAVLLGTSGVGKTFLMQKLFQDEIIEFKSYKLEIDSNLSYNFVDTTGFDFETDYEKREIQIKQFQELFLNYPKQISSLLIVVNFERTDLMKKKLLSIYKYFRKFQSLISIIVSDINYSEDEEKSKIDLIDNFKIFNPHALIFFRRDIQKNELIERLKVALIQVNPNHYFDLAETIFQKEDDTQIQEIQVQLMKRFIQ